MGVWFPVSKVAGDGESDKLSAMAPLVEARKSAVASIGFDVGPLVAEYPLLMPELSPEKKSGEKGTRSLRVWHPDRMQTEVDKAASLAMLNFFMFELLLEWMD